MKDAELPGQIHGAATRLVNYAEARLDLLQCEWAIERVRLAGLMGTTISTLFFSFLTIILVIMLIIAWYWDTPWRLAAIVVTLLLSLVCALVAAGRYRAKRREPSALFQHSVEECSRDRRTLDTLR